MDMFGGRSLFWALSGGTSSTSRTPVIDILASLRAALPNDVWQQMHNSSTRYTALLNDQRCSAGVGLHALLACLRKSSIQPPNATRTVAGVSTCRHNINASAFLPLPVEYGFILVFSSRLSAVD